MKPGLTPSLNKYTSAPIKAHDTFCWSCVLICGYVVDIFKPEMNMASLDFSDGTQKYHRDSIKNVCTDMEHFKSHSILYLLTAVALNVKIGLIKDSICNKYTTKTPSEGHSGSLYMAKCHGNTEWLDLMNVCEVVEFGSKIYWTAGSFHCRLRRMANVHEIRKVLGEEETDNNNISKMENHNVRRFDEILEVSDEIMKLMSRQCNLAGKCGTFPNAHPREYNQEAPPHCAECSDITNIVIDREDYIMLDASALSAMKTTFKHCNETIIMFTKFGRSAHQVTRYCPLAFMIVVTRNHQTVNQEHVYCDIF
ncbi:hypothetical protein U0070_013624, partial [Myodes glareolus]